jgi:hypothetical protein
MRCLSGRQTDAFPTGWRRFNKMTITAAKLIAKQKSQGSAGPLIVRDLSDPNRPVRLITFALGQSNPAVIVRSVGERPAFLERIELLEQDADTRLARYLVPNLSTPSDAEMWQGRTRLRKDRALPPTCAPISLKYSQHRAKRHDVATAIEGRRVQARCATSVKKQGIGTIEPITE